MDTKKVLIVTLLLVVAGALYVKFGKHSDSVKPTETDNTMMVPIVPVEPVEPVEPTIPPVEPIVDEPEVTDFSNYQEALAAANKYNRPIFLYFGAEWCTWCKKMKSETLSDIAIKDKLGKEYITCIIDTDKDRTTANKYKVSGIPAYMVIDSSEAIIIRDSGFKSKEDLLIWLKPKNVSLIK